jgi:signal transduction histidine kinase/CheY-like chemotaxis protein
VVSRATPYQLDLVANFGTWEWELATDEQSWSDELYAILGVSPETALPSQTSFTSVVHADDIARVAVALDRVRREGARAELELRVRAAAKGGNAVRFVRLRAWRTADERRLVALVEDVTSNSAIAERLSSVSAFAAGVAHEINNPLGFLSANLELIDEELGDDAHHELDVLLREARHGIQRIHTVVRGLMTFSRIEPTHHEPLDVNRLIEVALGIAHTEIRQRAKLVRDFRPVPHVDANAARLGQVFVNLLLNAAQAIPPGNHTDHEIVIATSVDSADRVVIEVRDTGRGIPRALGARVFEAFVTTKPVGAGVGLGLSVCRNIVNAIGGEIGFESEPGKTVFRVSLPATTTPIPVAPAEPSIAPSTRRGTVLVVDDEKIFASSLRRLLSREHDVSVCHDGKEALDRLRAGERFDAIISDLMMPNVSGIELYTQLAELAVGQAERMIFVTGGATHTAEFLAQITNPCFDKPCDLGALRAAIRRLVG